MLATYAFPSEPFCVRCFIADQRIVGRWRCRDCHFRHLVCRRCCRQDHELQPLHRIEKWTGTYFQQASLWEVGCNLQVLHQGRMCTALQMRLDDIRRREAIHDSKEQDSLARTKWVRKALQRVPVSLQTILRPAIELDPKTAAGVPAAAGSGERESEDKDDAPDGRDSDIDSMPSLGPMIEDSESDSEDDAADFDGLQQNDTAQCVKNLSGETMLILILRYLDSAASVSLYPLNVIPTQPDGGVGVAPTQTK
jgi:hypothetical protein